MFQTSSPQLGVIFSKLVWRTSPDYVTAVVNLLIVTNCNGFNFFFSCSVFPDNTTLPQLVREYFADALPYL